MLSNFILFCRLLKPDTVAICLSDCWTRYLLDTHTHVIMMARLWTRDTSGNVTHHSLSWSPLASASAGCIVTIKVTNGCDSVTKNIRCQNISRSPLQVLPHSWPWGEEEEPSVSEWWMTPSRSSSSSSETWSEDSRDTSSSYRRCWPPYAPQGSRGWTTTTTLSTWSAPPPAPPRPSAPWWRSTSLWTTNTSR